MLARPEDWPWSSVRAHAKGQSAVKSGEEDVVFEG
jgi:hypothetical protein